MNMRKDQGGTFEDFMKERGVELRPWQLEAAQGLLEVMVNHQGAATGKTFLMKSLSDFINKRGNAFQV